MAPFSLNVMSGNLGNNWLHLQGHQVPSSPESILASSAAHRPGGKYKATEGEEALTKGQSTPLNYKRVAKKCPPQHTRALCRHEEPIESQGAAVRLGGHIPRGLQNSHFPQMPAGSDTSQLTSFLEHRPALSEQATYSGRNTAVSTVTVSINRTRRCTHSAQLHLEGPRHSSIQSCLST